MKMYGNKDRRKALEWNGLSWLRSQKAHITNDATRMSGLNKYQIDLTGLLLQGHT